LAEVVGHARPGDTIVLSPGEYREIRIAKRHFEPAITLDATKATLYGLRLIDSGGFIIKGGEFRLPAPVTKPSTGAQIYGSALRMDRADHITIQGSHFVGPGHADVGSGLAYGEGHGLTVAHGSAFVVEDTTFVGFFAGLVFSEVDDFRISNVMASAMRSDGIDVAAGHNGVIEGIQCSDTAIRDKEHPDCIQLWSTGAATPTSDIVIRHNSIVGNTQGISLFSHGEGGSFDRITIEDNDVEVSMPDGITLKDSRNSIVRRNAVRTYGHGPYRAQLVAPGAKTCGNTVAPGGRLPGFSDEKC
jgi:hypothetical protein